MQHRLRTTSRQSWRAANTCTCVAKQNRGWWSCLMSLADPQSELLGFRAARYHVLSRLCEWRSADLTMLSSTLNQKLNQCFAQRLRNTSLMSEHHCSSRSALSVGDLQDKVQSPEFSGSRPRATQLRQAAGRTRRRRCIAGYLVWVVRAGVSRHPVLNLGDSQFCVQLVDGVGVFTQPTLQCSQDPLVADFIVTKLTGYHARLT